MKTSPYSPEPPRKSFIVNLIMNWVWLTNRTPCATPHLAGGNDISKVQYEYNEAHSFFERLNGYIGSTIMDGKDVLDAGCGWGGKMIYYAENYKARSISGFDLPGIYKPEVSAAFAQMKGVINCSFTTGYAEQMPYRHDQFDIILMDDVLEHVRDPQKVINECWRLLRPGGIVIIKFPSIKMMYAHHFDRAVTIPGLHYILSFKTWAAGLNYLLLTQNNKFNYEPFSEAVSTKYHKAVTTDLNGLDFGHFTKIIRESNFGTIACSIVSLITTQTRKTAITSLYSTAFRLNFLKEYLGNFILFIGRKDS